MGTLYDTHLTKVVDDVSTARPPRFPAALATRLGGQMHPRTVQTSVDLAYENACRERRFEIARRSPDWLQEEYERITRGSRHAAGLATQLEGHDSVAELTAPHCATRFRRRDFASRLKGEFDAERRKTASDATDSTYGVPAVHFDAYRTQPRLFMAGSRAWAPHFADDEFY